MSVPHTWNTQDVLADGDHYCRGIGWYRGSFDLPKNEKNRLYFVCFEGASVAADVFVNGKCIGKHKGGYSAFCFEITSCEWTYQESK